MGDIWGSGKKGGRAIRFCLEAREYGTRRGYLLGEKVAVVPMYLPSLVVFAGARRKGLAKSTFDREHIIRYLVK